MAKPAVEAVVDRLRQQILEGASRPGQRLDEVRLAGDLQVARNTLREAFRVLAVDGLVEHQAHRGVFVRTLSVHEAHDVYATRRLLECGALAEAAARHSARGSLSADQHKAYETHWETTVLEIERAVSAGVEAAARQDWRATGTANGDFHLAVAALADNSVLSRTLRVLMAELRLVFVVVDPADAIHARFLADNERVAELVAQRQFARAATAMESYLLRAEEVVVSSYAHLVAGG